MISELQDTFYGMRHCERGTSEAISLSEDALIGRLLHPAHFICGIRNDGFF
jgi:hypothetical protein